MWDAWSAGDRRTAAASVPDEVIDALVVHGTPDECRRHVQRYVDGGITTPALALLPTPELEAGGAPVLVDTLRALGAAG
jgi:alkanesulfonate monooxygenase SsuD/methylene tetrahydromethanopterin reductase-like flavin-dependent oxidoreductase (luciferase family)